MTGCINWPGRKDSDGYGQLFIPGLSGSRGVHRLFYSANKGPIPEGFCVLHSCDNRGCVNPEHLFLGTSTDKNRACVAHGRHRVLRGVAHPLHKLSEENARTIKNLKGALSQTALARMYGISPSVVSRIQSGEKWPHITREVAI
jgi:HNH endonuclease